MGCEANRLSLRVVLGWPQPWACACNPGPVPATLGPCLLQRRVGGDGADDVDGENLNAIGNGDDVCGLGLGFCDADACQS